MDESKALQMAIEALKYQVKLAAVDANLFDFKFADYPYAKKASKRKKELLEAIAVLEKMLGDH